MTDGQQKTPDPENLLKAMEAANAKQMSQDRLVNLYREAVAQDAGPSTQAREALFAYAKSKATGVDEGLSAGLATKAEVKVRSEAKALKAEDAAQTAANDSYWPRHTFAAIAAMAVAGWLFMHQLPGKDASTPHSDPAAPTSAPVVASAAKPAADNAQESAEISTKNEISAANSASRTESALASKSKLGRSMPEAGEAHGAGELASLAEGEVVVAPREISQIDITAAKPQVATQEANQAQRALPYCDELARHEGQGLPSATIAQDAQGGRDEQASLGKGKRANERAAATGQPCRQRDKTKSKAEVQAR